jgi:monoamine oxidase
MKTSTLASAPAAGRTPLFRKLMGLVARAALLEGNPRRDEILERWSGASGRGRSSGSSTRRDFLRGSLAAGAAVAAAGLACRRDIRADDDPAEAVAIVGAGVAGLTAAYRLAAAGIASEVFEASERVGGRIFTREKFNDAGMFCELGGELVDSNHEDLIELCGELGLEIQELKAGDSGVDFYFFGGKRRQDADLLPLFEPLARHLKVDAAGLYKDDESYSDKASRFDRISIEEYLSSKKDVDKWVIDVIRVAYTGEFGLEAGEQSSLNLLSYINPDTSGGFQVFGDSDESKRVRGGNSALTRALERAIDGKVPIHRGERLVRIRDDGSRIELSFQAGWQTKARSFRQVVCAIPFTMLRQVEGVLDLHLDPRQRDCIQKLGYGTNVKVMYGFRERVWRRAEAAGPQSNGSVYTDLPSQCFWETSRGQKGDSGILTNYLGGAAGKGFHPKRFDETLAELDRIFPGAARAFDDRKAMMNWPSYQFTLGSYTCPKIGQVTTILASAGQTALEGRLLFAGEHTSEEFSGFMNGAVESGNRAAKEIIAKRRPAAAPPAAANLDPVPVEPDGEAEGDGGEE